MKHIYHIEGMTCNGCRAGVEETLNRIAGVVKATVDLEKKEAVVDMDHHINLDEFQNALSDKYTITKKTSTNIFDTTSQLSQVDQKTELQKLTPLFIIFGYITIAATLLNYNPWIVGGFMLDFMGLFYIVFSFFKVLDLKGFPDSFRMYDPLAKAIPVYGWIYPFIEIALGLMFLMRFQIHIALIATIVILGVTTVGVTKVLLDKKSIQCACLGTALKLPMTKATFIENTVMLVMAIVMLLK